MTQTRMSKAERREQLLWLAADIVREEGADNLTLTTLADRAGVSKPITYNHFGDRKGLLSHLYQGYDERLLHNIRSIDPSRLQTIEQRAHTLATAYFECTAVNGDVYDAVVSALCSYAEFASLRTQICFYFVDFYRELFAETIHAESGDQTAVLVAIYGAGDELARALTAGYVSKERAIRTFSELIPQLLQGKTP